MVVAAVVTHVMPYLGSIGIGRSPSSLVATAIPLTSVFGRLGFGWLGDKISKKMVAAASFIMSRYRLTLFRLRGHFECLAVSPFSDSDGDRVRGQQFAAAAYGTRVLWANKLRQYLRRDGRHRHYRWHNRPGVGRVGL